MSKLAWNEINWTLVQKRISRQQRRIYKASMEGNKAKIHAIQRRIIASLDAKLLAVRLVTIKKNGHKQANSNLIKTISNDQKIKLAYQLNLNGKTSYIKKTDILKSKKSESNLLEIMILEDRAKQMLAKLALEPEWEAIFEPNSYGFRPGRSYNDSIHKISLLLKGKSQYILSVNLQKSFEQIKQDKLLKKLSTFPLMEDQIKAWLKANILIEYLKRPKEIFQSLKDISQNYIISPLLINIALHGLNCYVQNWYDNFWSLEKEKSIQNTKTDKKSKIGFSRYVNDFIITTSKQIEIQSIKKVVKDWMYNEIGLILSKEETNVINSKDGFEFLGFQIISIQKKSIKAYKVKIYPSKTSKLKIIKRIRNIIQKNKSISSYQLINLLSNQIVNWAYYFQYSECNKDFSKIDFIIFNQVRAWVFRRKSKGLRSRTKLKLKYFPEGKSYRFREKTYKNNWILTGKTVIKGKKKENFLPKMLWVGSSKYMPIEENKSPFDGDHIYWCNRAKKY